MINFFQVRRQSRESGGKDGWKYRRTQSWR